MPCGTYLGSTLLLWAENYSLLLGFPTHFAAAQGHVVRAEIWKVLLELPSFLCFRHCHERVMMRISHVWNRVANQDLQSPYHPQRYD